MDLGAWRMSCFPRRMMAWPKVVLCFSVLRDKSVFCQIQQNYIDRWILVGRRMSRHERRMAAWSLLFLCFSVLREKSVFCKIQKNYIDRRILWGRRMSRDGATDDGLSYTLSVF